MKTPCFIELSWTDLKRPEGRSEREKRGIESYQRRGVRPMQTRLSYPVTAIC